MIAQSTREDIATYTLSTVTGISDFNTVVRRIPLYEQLKDFAVTQFPVGAVVAKMPVPNEKESARIPAKLDLIVSDLDVDVYGYLQNTDDDTVDTSISDLLNKIWVAMYADPTLGNRVLNTWLKPEPEVEYWYPFVAFKVVVKVRYVHTTGGL